ncbi:MAG: isoprenylcysteine carboxylmethyltransferase family protein [bacterium]
MALIEEYEKTGNMLFKKRSYLPLLLYVLATVTIYFDRTVFADTSNVFFSVVCLIISLFGLFIRIITIGYAQKNTSGRNVNGQVADSLNTKGIYSVVRHPLYLGNFFMWIGIVIYVANFWLIITVILLFWIYYERIMFAEEGYLRNKFGEAYTAWAMRIPAFVPSFKLWEKTDSNFNVKDVIRREYYGLTALAVSFAYINFIKNYLYKGIFELDIFWLYILIISIIMFLVLRFLKKKTRVLK